MCETRSRYSVHPWEAIVRDFTSTRTIIVDWYIWWHVYTSNADHSTVGTREELLLQASMSMRSYRASVQNAKRLLAMPVLIVYRHGTGPAHVHEKSSRKPCTREAFVYDFVSTWTIIVYWYGIGTANVHKKILYRSSTCPREAFTTTMSTRSATDCVYEKEAFSKTMSMRRKSCRVPCTREVIVSLCTPIARRRL